jgi:Ca2+-binding EF-hand superfamily protein
MPLSFQAIDANNDGKVDLDEVKKAASAKFDSLDRNRTGTLTRREVGRLRLNRKDFAAADPGKDGQGLHALLEGHSGS